MLESGELVGWATCEKEAVSPHSFYMNLLVVKPGLQQLGIGKALVFSLRTLKIDPELQAINLMLRSKNRVGKTFYRRVGFSKNLAYTRTGNYVSMELLEPWTWTRKGSEE